MKQAACAGQLRGWAQELRLCILYTIRKRSIDNNRSKYRMNLFGWAQTSDSDDLYPTTIDIWIKNIQDIGNKKSLKKFVVYKLEKLPPVPNAPAAAGKFSFRSRKIQLLQPETTRRSQKTQPPQPQKNRAQARFHKPHYYFTHFTRPSTAGAS